MSDEQLRELERRWRETRSVEDEAAYLAERVRAGDLARERLAVAAYAGHAAARAVLGGSDDDPSWPFGLAAFGRTWLYRAALFAAESLLPEWNRLMAGVERRERIEAAIRAAHQHLDCPCVEHLSAVRNVTGRLVTLGMREVCDTPARRLVLDAAHGLLIPANLQERHDFERTKGTIQRSLDLAAQAIGYEAVRAYVNENLVRLALQDTSAV